MSEQQKSNLLNIIPIISGGISPAVFGVPVQTIVQTIILSIIGAFVGYMVKLILDKIFKK